MLINPEFACKIWCWELFFCISATIWSFPRIFLKFLQTHLPHLVILTLSLILKIMLSKIKTLILLAWAWISDSIQNTNSHNGEKYKRFINQKKRLDNSWLCVFSLFHVRIELCPLIPYNYSCLCKKSVVHRIDYFRKLVENKTPILQKVLKLSLQ